MQAADTNALKTLVGARITDRIAGRGYAVVANLVGVTAQAIGKWARGEGLPDPKYWDALATALYCTVDYLLGRTDDPQGTISLRMEPGWEGTIRRANEAGLTPAAVDAAIEFLRKMQKQGG